MDKKTTGIQYASEDRAVKTPESLASESRDTSPEVKTQKRPVARGVQDPGNSERQRTHSAIDHRSPQHQRVRLSMAEETSPLRVFRGVKESQNKVLDKSRRPRDVSHGRIGLLRMSREALKTRWS